MACDCDGISHTNECVNALEMNAMYVRLQAAERLYTWIINVATDSQLDVAVPALGGLTGRKVLILYREAGK